MNRARSGGPVIELSHVTKKFGELVAIKDVGLVVNEKEIVCLVGPSGCGKSTMLNLVAGFDSPTEGEVRVRNRKVQEPGPDRAVVFQQDALFPWQTVWKNVVTGPETRGAKSYEDKARTLLEQVHLEDFHDHYPYELSGGMRQRAAIARALMSDLDVLLMDEPFGALDAQTRAEMQSLLQEIWDSYETTILFITHDIEEALILGDRVMVMSDRPGQIIETMDVTFDRPRSPDLTTGQDFNEMKSRIMHLLHPGDDSASSGSS